MSKYSRLEEFLSLHRENKVTLTLKQIEIIINDVLPKTAHIYHAWWYGERAHVKKWTEIGWAVEVHTVRTHGKIEWVTFKKPAALRH